MFHILVVEDDTNTRKLTCDVLSDNGYTPIEARDGIEALEIMDEKHVDLIIMDVMMPRMDGLELCETIRKAGFQTPILMVTAKETAFDKKQGFIKGTDDYMVKPVDEEEMLLRIQALLRRSQIVSDHKITVGDTTLDYDALTIKTPEGIRELPPKEFMLLYKLLSYPDKIFTRRQLMDELWDMTSDTDERTVDVHINRIREHLKNNRDFEIMTVRGLGYKAVKLKDRLMKKHLISALRSERRRNYTMNASIVSAVFMIMIWAGLLTGFIMIGIKRCLHFLSPLQMPFVFLIVGLVVSVIIGTCISAAVASKIVRPVREVKKAMHRVEKGDFSQRLEVTGFNGEIDELIESYNKMAQELGGIEMFRENFINSFSHEFKTPIVSIQGFAKQLKKENLSEEKKQEYIDIIISESKRLTNLSSNILMLSKLENQQIITDKTSFSLDEQIRNCILLLEKQWTAKDISFDIDMQEIQYTTNAEMLSQVWVNIIGNAIKFSPEGSSIRVKLFKEGDVITAEITDRGIGMDQQTISHIFERFYQGDRAHASEGNGLGLPLVKRIVELCNGNIRVESQYGKGTNFIVTLPQNG